MTPVEARQAGYDVRVLPFRAHSHGVCRVDYRVDVGPGNLYGILWPKRYPKTALLGSLYWAGGQDVVVPNSAGAWDVPLDVTRRFRFWTAGFATLVCSVALPAPIVPSKVARDAGCPVVTWVAAVENGREVKAPSWKAGNVA